jgi:hypothetical protein
LGWSFGSAPIFLFYRRIEMIMKCSECGGDVKTTVQTDLFKIVRCLKCGRERRFEEKIIETIDMSEKANLQVIME